MSGSVALLATDIVGPEHVRRLGAAQRETLYQLVEDDHQLRRMGRLISVLPVALFPLYPILLPWLLKVCWRTWRTLRQPELRELRSAVDQKAVKRLKPARKAEHIEDRDIRALIAMRSVPAALTLGIVGPPSLVAGFVVLWWLLAA